MGGNKAGSLVPSLSWSKTIPLLFCLMLPAELSLAVKQKPRATLVLRMTWEVFKLAFIFRFLDTCFTHLHSLSIFGWTGPEGVWFTGTCPAVPPQSACNSLAFQWETQAETAMVLTFTVLRPFPLSLYQSSLPLQHWPPTEYSSLRWKPWFDYCHRKAGDLGKPLFLTHTEVLVAIPASNSLTHGFATVLSSV